MDLREKHELALVWVRGHDGDPENERCDVLAEAQAHADEADLPPDQGYEAAIAKKSAEPSLFD